MIKLSKAYQVMQDDWVYELAKFLNEKYDYPVRTETDKITIGKLTRPYIQLTVKLVVSSEQNIADKNFLVPQYTSKEKKK